MKTLIISGGTFEKDFLEKNLQKDAYDYVIAVDRGAQYAKELEIMPNLIVGDFDSVDSEILEKYDESIVRGFKPEKDDTDTEIAIREAIKYGNEIDIICATGGRIDHLLGNIHILKIALDNNVSAKIIDSRNVVFLKNKTFSIKRSDYNGRYISFIPFDGIVTNIKLKGLKYPLDGYDLKPGITRCISNEFICDEASVEFDSGCLIVVISLDVESE